MPVKPTCFKVKVDKGTQAPMCCPWPIGFIYVILRRIGIYDGSMDVLLVDALFFGALDSSVVGLRFCSSLSWFLWPLLLLFSFSLPSYSLEPFSLVGFRHLQAFDIFIEQAGVAVSLVYDLYILMNWHTNSGLGWRWGFVWAGWVRLWFWFFGFLS